MSSTWPRMHSGQKNPFQNAPGPFIYALPNLAGTCPFSYSDTVLSCSFPGAGDSNVNDAPDPDSDPDSDRHHCHHHHCFHNTTVASCCRHRHHHDPPSESADSEPPTAPTEEAAPPVKEVSPSPGPRPRPLPSSVSLSLSDENHFALSDAIPSSLTEGGRGGSAEQQEPQASEPSTPTSSNAPSSPTGPVFQEGSKEEEGEEKDGKKKRHRRKRGGRRSRFRNEHGAGSIGPRFMGLSGTHYNLWTQYAMCPQAQAQAQASPLFSPPPPAAAAAMNHHHAWPCAGCHHHGAFVIPPNSPAPQFWTIPMVPATPGFVGVPVVASC